MAELTVTNSSDDGGPLERPRKGSSSKGTSRPRILPVQELMKSRKDDWTMFTASQNLPSALNDPNNRELDLFTRTWGDSFIPHAPLPPSYLPNIELGDFLRYLKETASGRKSHRAIVRETSNSNPSTPVSPSPRRQLQLDGKMYDLNNIPKVFTQKDFSLEDSRTFLQVIPLPHLLPQTLTSPIVMKVEGGENVATLQSTKLLHEKLTHHLDVVEVHLAHQISLRSDVFFSTLASQRELESLIMQVRQDVLELRHHIRLLDKTLTHPSVKTYYLRRRQRRLSLVCHQLHQIATIHQTQHTIQLLLGTSDFVGALELISRTQSVLSTELQGVVCLRHLGSQLAELERAIEAMMENDFVHVALEDVRARVRYADKGERLGSPEGVDTEIQLESVVKGLLRRRKLQFVSNLREQVLTTAKKHVKQVVEDFLQIPQEISEEEDTEEPTLTLADRIRAMEFDLWHDLLDHLFSSLLIYMRCVQKMLSVITLVCQEVAGVLTPLSITPAATPTKPHISEVFRIPSISSDLGRNEGEGGDMEMFADQEAEDRLDQLLMEEELSDAKITMMAISAENITKEEVENVEEQEQEERSTTAKVVATRNLEIDNNGGLTGDECQELMTECHEIVCGLCDLLHSRCTKILNIRAKAGLLDNLHPADFVKLVRLIGRFVNSSAGITGRPCPHLRLALLSQAKKFLEIFHESKKEKLRRLLDGERWRQADIPPEVQQLTTSLEQGLAQSNGLNDKQIKHVKPVLSSQSSQHTEQQLTVHGQKFAVVGVLCLLVTMVTEYCQTADDLPMLITDILGRLVDLLKFFNTYTCQLVLGAGAVEVVGLKTITTRHLALVLRCLQAVMLLIPDIKTHFRKRLTPKKCVLLLQFDQVSEDIGSHCREINHKIITIMDELIAKLLTKWEVKSPTPSQSFKTMIKQLLKLHEALDDLLPADHLQALFQGIEHNFISRLKSHLTKLNITNNGSTEHGIVNSELTNMKSALEQLEHITSFGNSLFDIWTINR